MIPWNEVVVLDDITMTIGNRNTDANRGQEEPTFAELQVNTGPVSLVDIYYWRHNLNFRWKI